MATAVKTPYGTWRIQVEVKGQRDAKTFPTKREATEWATVRSMELRAVGSGQTGTVKTVADALADYAEKISPTKKGEAKELLRLKAFLKHKAFPAKVKLSDLTTQHLAEWRDQRLKEVSTGTVLRDIVLMGHVLEIARREWGWIKVNPMRDMTKPTEPDHREILITGVEVRKMLRALRWSNKPVRSVSHAVANAFLFALQTGSRAGEICGIRWEDVKDGYVKVDGKTGKRDVPVVPTTLRTIERMRGYDEEYVFGLNTKSLDAMFRKYRDRAGLGGFTFHDTRHTAATRLAQSLHELDLCKMFGWKKADMALVYYNPKAADIGKRITAAAPTRSSR